MMAIVCYSLKFGGGFSIIVSDSHLDCCFILESVPFIVYSQTKKVCLYGQQLKTLQISVFILRQN